MAQVKLETKYVDIPDLSETFADHIEKFFFDGQTLRIEFCVKRIEEAQPQKAPTGKRYPVCRLVLHQEAAIDLINKLQGLAAAMEKQGIVKRQQGAKADASPNSSLAP